LNIAPIHIRPHLVPFFFKEFEGKEAAYLGKKVTAIKVASFSSLGHMMRLFTMQVPKEGKSTDHFNIYLSVEDTPDGKKYEGNYYRYHSGPDSFLDLPQDVHDAINDLMEDIFRMAFISFIDGYMIAPKAVIIQGINTFIDKYDLLEVGFSTESMRTLYYREKKKAA